MNYPLISEYIEAIKSAEDNFEKLSYLRPVLGDDGLPVMTSGNFAVVFKMKDEQSEKFYAVKCFTKEQEGRAEAYREITKELKKDVSSPYLTSVRYLDKELFVDTDQTSETEFPVLLMDWVEGKTLDKYLRENLDDKFALEMLAYRFSQLAQWLIPQPFAHGDLKPDNILVRDDGTLVLVDYDGMYVPAMKGQKARELGSPDFRHPLRIEDDFDEHIDDFPLVTILLSLKAISLQPCLLGKYGASDRLLFSEKDYRNISKCGLLKELFPSSDSELNVLVCLFMLAYEKSNLSDVSFRLINPIKPQAQESIILSTEITDEDIANAWIDEYGVMYSSDKKRLLHAPMKLTDYSIRKGTLVICNGAFYRDLISIHIPDGVTDIGKCAFSYCSSLTSIKLPDSVVNIGERAFYGCFNLTSINIPDSILRIGDGAFGFCKLNYIYIPYGVTSIGDDTFFKCNSLISIQIPDSVLNIGESAFEECYNLTIITIPIGTRRKFEDMLPDYKNILVEQEIFHKFSTEVLDEDVTNAWIDEYGFSYSNDKTKLLYGPTEIHSTYKICDYTIREGTIVICNRAFDRGVAENLNYANIIIPERVTHIGDFAFGFQDYIETITIPWSVVHIGINPFIGCNNLEDIITLSNKYVVHDKTLYSVCKVKEDTWIQEKKIISYWGKNYSLNLKRGIVEIGDCAFESTQLRIIKLPDSIRKIGKDAFLYCLLLEHIIVPVGELPKFKKLLPQHLHDKLVEDIDSDGFPYIV